MSQMEEEYGGERDAQGVTVLEGLCEETTEGEGEGAEGGGGVEEGGARVLVIVWGKKGGGGVKGMKGKVRQGKVVVVGGGELTNNHTRRHTYVHTHTFTHSFTQFIGE